MRVGLPKEQQQELRHCLEKMKVPHDVIEHLLTSQQAGQTQKAFIHKKVITTPEGWIINFNNRSAKAPIEFEAPHRNEEPDSLMLRTLQGLERFAARIISKEPAANDTSPAITKTSPATNSAASNNTTPIKPKTKPVEFHKLTIEVSEDQLEALNKLAKEKGVSINAIIRAALNRFLKPQARETNNTINKQTKKA
ncbi:MAG: CopG family transcriptional regulator [Gammaproteobacteria bacterium]|nr:CopG family transcriptional regulator [Gammaproteobacteria bacterium]